jgi:hypothetical protein
VTLLAAHTTSVHGLPRFLGRADSAQLADLSVAAIRSKTSVPLHSGRGYLGRIADPVVPRDGVNAEAWKEQAAANGE